MAISTLDLPQPIRRRPQVAPRDFAKRDRAIELFDAGDYAESVAETLRYLLPGVPIPDLTAEALCFEQGSARVRAEIDAQGFSLSTVLAALTPEAQVTAALRFFLSRISATGQVFQPRLRGEVVTLEFRDPLPLLHPVKLGEVLQRLPMEADNNDAWMVREFGVATPDRAEMTPLSADEFERALAIWEGHWAAVDELMTESRRRRSVRFLDALGSYAANQVRYTLPLYGSLRARIQEASDTYTDKDEHPNKRDSVLAKAIKEMRQVGADELRACLGHARYAINPLQEGTPSLLSSLLGGQRMQTTGELRAVGRSLEAALELIADYLYLLAYHSWPADIEATLRQGLDQASGKPWREAADGLWNHANAIVRTYGSHGERDREEDADADDADGASLYDQESQR
ncbi:MAG: hypothetical protein U1F26_01960 [Lysobacterales bacterium]